MVLCSNSLGKIRKLQKPKKNAKLFFLRDPCTHRKGKVTLSSDWHCCWCSRLEQFESTHCEFDIRLNRESRSIDFRVRRCIPRPQIANSIYSPEWDFLYTKQLVVLASTLPLHAVCRRQLVHFQGVIRTAEAVHVLTRNQRPKASACPMNVGGSTE